MSRVLLIDKGWRRHSVISHRNGGLRALQASLPKVIQKLLAIDNVIAIIATYDCAVIEEDFDKEPWVQLLISFPTNLDRRLTKCRNPRRLHFTIRYKAEERHYEINAAGMCQIDRQILCNIEPDADFEVPPDSKNNINYWVAERFRQETWPDEFNKAIEPIKDRLKRFFKRYNDYASALYLGLHTYEELQGEKYQISAVFAIGQGQERALINELRKRDKQLADKNIDEVKKYLESEIVDIFGDTVKFATDPSSSTQKAVEVLEESMITVSMLKTHFRFSPYYLSAQDIAVPVPVDTIPGKV